MSREWAGQKVNGTFTVRILKMANVPFHPPRCIAVSILTS